MFLSPSALVILGIVGVSLPQATHAAFFGLSKNLGKSEYCPGAREFFANCTEGPLVDPLTSAELMNYTGFNTYVTNDNGCWFHGVVYEHSGSYGIDITNQAKIECYEASSTTLKVCVGDCPFELPFGLGTLGDYSPAQRHLKGGNNPAFSLKPGDNKYQEYAEQCGDEEYKVALVIEKTHFYAVAQPVLTSRACPSFLTNALFNEDHYLPSAPAYHKDLWAVEGAEWTLFGRNQDELEDYSHHIGNFVLSELIHAHESVDPQKAPEGLDIVKLNCADFMLSLASALNVKIDAKLTSFVARRLLQDSGKELAGKIRNSMHFLSIFGEGRRGLLRKDQQDMSDDAQVLQALFDQRLLAAGVTDLDTGSVFAAAAAKDATTRELGDDAPGGHFLTDIKFLEQPQA